MKKTFLILSTSLAIISLDFLTKRLIEKYVHPYEAINVFSFLNIVNVKNTGAAFGLFSNLSNQIFIYISLLAILLIIIYLFKTHLKLEIVSLSLILGGAAGNLIDRLTIGKVIDFIDFFVGDWHWPAFNVADSSLSIGIVLFLLANMRQREYREKHTH